MLIITICVIEMDETVLKLLRERLGSVGYLIGPMVEDSRSFMGIRYLRR